MRPTEPPFAHHLDRIAQVYRGNLTETCDIAPASIVLWAEKYGYRVEDFGAFLLVVADNGPGGPYCLQPILDLDRLEKHHLEEIAKIFDWPLIFRHCGTRFRDKVRSLGFKAETAANPDYFDYKYCRKAFSECKGKAFHAKRNLLRQFEKACPKWRLRPLEDDDRTELLDFLKTLRAEEGGMRHSSAEIEAFGRALDYFGALGLFGRILKVGNAVLGFALASLPRPDLAIVHFEKCARHFPGAHQMLARAFVASLPGEVRFINREQDLGVPGLRQAKRSWRPVDHLEKSDLVVFRMVHASGG